jgi:hypothetical protein
MANYEIGYGKPPLSGRFRVGASGNPRGRPKRKPTPLAERIKSLLNAPIEYRERGRTKVGTYRELTLKTLVERAINGDLDAAEMVLKIVDRATRRAGVSLSRRVAPSLEEPLGPARAGPSLPRSSPSRNGLSPSGRGVWRSGPENRSDVGPTGG